MGKDDWDATEKKIGRKPEVWSVLEAVWIYVKRVEGWIDKSW